MNRIKLQTNGTVPPPPASNGVAPVTPKRMVIQDESTTPDTVTLAAKDAEQGKLYVLPNGTAAKFTCGIGVGGNTFYSFSTGEGTTPLLLQANDRIKLVEAPKPIETPKPVEVVKLIEAPKAEPIAGKTEVAEEKKRGPGRPKKTDTIDAPVEHTSVAPSATAERGIRLYVNAIPNGPFTPLDGYVTGMLKTMHEEFEVLDIRCAPNANSPLAYAKWKGVLASLVRNAPPADGVYVAFTKGNEIAEVVVEALTGLCAPGALVRGVC